MATVKTAQSTRAPKHIHNISLSSTHSQKQNVSTTPLAHPAQTPASVGQHPSQRREFGYSKADAPNYFELVIDGADRIGSHENQLPPPSWRPSGSTMQTTNPRGSSYVPLNEQPEFEAFRRAAERHNFARESLTRACSGSSPDSSDSSQESFFKSSDSIDPMDIDSTGPSSDDNSKAGVYTSVRTESPQNLKTPFPRHIQDERMSRLSLPHVEAGPSNSSAESLNTSLTRASTLPASPNDEVLLVSPANLDNILDTGKTVLILDFRTSAMYHQSRLSGALNLCIPTTLLKRPLFGIQKLLEAFKSDSEREEFQQWRSCHYIVVYDTKSSSYKEGDLLIHALKKFTREGFSGQPVIIRGGFQACQQLCPNRIDHSRVRSASSSSRSSSVDSNLPAVAQVAGGCAMPQEKNAANPFFSNIRQNMDLIGGVGQIAVQRPSMSSSVERQLPRWMRQAAAESDKGKTIAARFLEIELAEKKRMEAALSTRVRYDTSPSDDEVRLAGLEKGPKNRYNNIWPYEHARVRLQNVPDDCCDYINASHIISRASAKKYISTQAPLPATFNDFWSMIWDEDVRVIVMLTAEQEGGQVKAQPYWRGKSYGPFKLKQLAERRVQLAGRPGSPSSSDDESDAHFLIARKFALTHSSMPFEPLREITQLQYSSWPDFGAPASPAQLLSIIRHTDKFARHAGTANRPIVVHCSAGCGRTGTFCTIDSTIDRIRRLGAKAWMGSTSEDDLIEEMVKEFRGQRLSMVQNLRQFVLCYETVLEYLVEKIVEEQEHSH